MLTVVASVPVAMGMAMVGLGTTAVTVTVVDIAEVGATVAAGKREPLGAFGLPFFFGVDERRRSSKNQSQRGPRRWGIPQLHKSRTAALEVLRDGMAEICGPLLGRWRDRSV